MSIPDPALGTPRIGIVGAGRTRQGLGPFLATWCERVGARVVGVSGRDLARTAAAAATLARQLGHEVAAHADAESLARSVDALVVACPVQGHLVGLDAALAAGVPCLCEKPLVAAADTDAGIDRVAQFAARGLLLEENCQWPFTLPALFELYPGLRAAAVTEVGMRLSPAGVGIAMVEDSLSHVLSLVQALVPLGPDVSVGDVGQSDARAASERNVVAFALFDGLRRVKVRLELECVPQQPRPAWFAVDGVRIDRRIGPDYGISFVAADGRAVALPDPLGALLRRFVQRVSGAEPDAAARSAAAVLQRQRCYRDVLVALG